MITENLIPEPFVFNPLKHHLGYIKDFINSRIDGTSAGDTDLVRELRHIGTSVMDVYTGPLTITAICAEIHRSLSEKKLLQIESFAQWTGIKRNSYKIMILSDNSRWTLKFHKDDHRYVHFFPARNPCRYGMHNVSTGIATAFRVKSNTLKSALLYIIMIGKDLVTADDLNRVRPLIGLSPVKDPADTEAILEIIEILRN
jgi:hypothetical protein